MKQISGKGHRLLRPAAAAMLLAVLAQPVLAAGQTAAVQMPGSIPLIYGITSFLALLMLLGYCWMIRQKNLWLLLLYICVLIVNLGYLTLSISRTLEEAMLANRIAYLGSVFLPLFMLMIVEKLCGLRFRKVAFGILLTISIATFFLAASGGYVDLYYKEVTLEFADGAALLKKVYGPLHGWYLIYLLMYFGWMVAEIVYAVIRKKVVSYKHAALLAGLVLGNIAVWYVEQHIDWNFEFLSVTYILTELILLLLYDMLEDYEQIHARQRLLLAALAAQQLQEECGEAAAVQQLESAEETAGMDSAELSQERIAQILCSCPTLQRLTQREREVLEAMLQNKRRKQIAEQLFVTENTVKKHTSNIFAKLGVSSRKELFAQLDRQTPNVEL